MLTELAVALLQTQVLSPATPAPSVSRSGFTSAIVDREPADHLEDLAEGDASVLFFSELRQLEGRTLHHVWRCDNGRIVRIAFDVRGPRWRVWSRRPSMGCSRWTVAVESEGAPLVVATLDVLRTISIDVLADLHYVAEGFPMGLAAGQSPAGGLSKTPSERLVTEPPYESATVLYGYFPLGNGADRRVTFVVDAVDPAPQVWFDRNNNEDLTDDGPPTLNQGTGLFAARVSVLVSSVTREVEPPVDGRRYDVWLWLSAPSRDTHPPEVSAFRPFFYAVGHYAGVLTVARESFDVVAFERRSYDAVFEDGDICLDLDRDRKCSEPGELVHDGQRLSIAGRPYRLRLKLH